MAELTAKGRATRARILAAAAELILVHGVAGTQIEDVRKAAEVSGSQMTHYFHDKRTLIKEVIAWQADRVVGQNPIESFEAWRSWADRVIERQTAREFKGGCDFGSLAGQLVESDAETRADLAAGYERWLDLFRRSLDTMRSRGELRADADPDALAQSILAALQGGLLLSQTLRRVEPLRNSLHAALTYVGSYADPGRRPS